MGSLDNSEKLLISIANEIQRGGKALSMLEQNIQKIFDLNTKITYEGNTLLYFAFTYNDPCIPFLLEHGAKVTNMWERMYILGRDNPPLLSKLWYANPIFFTLFSQENLSQEMFNHLAQAAIKEYEESKAEVMKSGRWKNAPPPFNSSKLEDMPKVTLEEAQQAREIYLQLRAERWRKEDEEKEKLRKQEAQSHSTSMPSTSRAGFYSPAPSHDSLINDLKTFIKNTYPGMLNNITIYGDKLLFECQDAANPHVTTEADPKYKYYLRDTVIPTLLKDEKKVDEKSYLTNVSGRLQFYIKLNAFDLEKVKKLSGTSERKYTTREEHQHKP